MIRFGGSPYASQTPQTVVTVVQIITACRMASFGAAASIRMITSVRIVSPIIDTPSRMPDANATTAVTAMTVGRMAPPFRRSRTERDALEHSRLRDDGDEERQAENEQHRVGVDQLVEPVERQHVLPHPRPPAALDDLCVPLRGLQPAERGDDDERHPVGQRVLVNLVLEGPEDEQPEDGEEDFRGEERDRQRRHRGPRQSSTHATMAHRHRRTSSRRA